VALAGIALGLAGAFALTRFMRALLFGVGAGDPATFVLIASTLGIVALAASYLPARRAAAVDPLVSLRME
jgi:putative ABC transport system permease protein